MADYNAPAIKPFPVNQNRTIWCRSLVTLV